MKKIKLTSITYMPTKSLKLIGSFITATFFIQCSDSTRETVSFYSVPLECGAAPGLGCGSRIKPLFIETEKEKSIKESWTNREGTILAFVWNENENEELIQSLFEGNDIDGELILDTTEISKISEEFRQQGKWLKGMEVDKLSIEEAGVIAKDLTEFAEEENRITHEEGDKIRKELEEYFKKELVVVRTYHELQSPSIRTKWLYDGHAIFEKYIGKQRADSVKSVFDIYANEDEEENEISLESEITCPKCGHKKTETLPTDICLLKYTCEKCKIDLFPEGDDCCVFCSYGTHKCPSKQEEYR